MQPAIARVLSALTPYRPLPDRQSEPGRDEAARFASQLLENYKAQLAQGVDASARQQS